MTEEQQADVPSVEQPAPEEHSEDRVEVTIRLDQFLQGCGVATGGQAKRIIQAGEVLVNDQVETRRKKKLVVGDEVTLDDEVYVVAVDDDGSDPSDGASLETDE
jgi:ribosome-associated protein